MYNTFVTALLLVSEMSLAVIESILESTHMGEVLRQFQDLDITYLLTVFFSVFLANVGIETVKSIIGRPIINFKIMLLSFLQLTTMYD